MSTAQQPSEYIETDASGETWRPLGAVSGIVSALAYTFWIAAVLVTFFLVGYFGVGGWRP